MIHSARIGKVRFKMSRRDPTDADHQDLLYSILESDKFSERPHLGLGDMETLDMEVRSGGLSCF